MSKKLKIGVSKDDWFSLWHTHFDWDGDGNENWDIRLKYLNEMIDAYHQAKEQLKQFPKPYQIWILIHENDSASDALYIHSSNPNSDNFPVKLKEITKVSKPYFDDKRLEQFIKQQYLEVVQVFYNGKKQFYLFDKNVGEPLI